ncbi:MAG: M1 family metallopeptidase [Bacteroidales bacterium]|nr:M1 family metallopeptidase [Bacteroidales bacterium]
MKKGLLIAAMFVLASAQLIAQQNPSKFHQLKEEFATPNVYRTASGAPGHAYWQQKADYVITIRLDDEKQRISGEETITYSNQSPDELTYLWVQLDQNMRAKDSDRYKITTSEMRAKMNLTALKRLESDFDGGFKLDQVTDTKGKALDYTINGTMMRIDLPAVLKPNSSFSFRIKWWYNINDHVNMGGRSGYEYFPEDDNYLYIIAQFYPRMAVYNEVEGWQNKQFLGRGEFTLPFGDFKVSITVPSDHIVGATGVLQNQNEVLSAKQRALFNEASESDVPVVIVNQDEAVKAEKNKATTEKTWVFKAENVRDFAFATSRKFIWDAQAVKFGNRRVMAMSFYPKEGNPLWGKYSTKVVAHTIRTYSQHTFDYPYPTAISVHTAQQGMEYPMICFNGGRPEKDGTYSERTKYGMIGVIIHEVGHNFFPMIVNSDERQWTWMDEGMNTFLQYLTEQAWERDYPSRNGPAYAIVDYMKGDKKNIMPIMTNSESLLQFHANAYSKPATALNILRETIMGRELFDFSFKTYAQRWMFKHPSPEDFFRTMEDASAVDLDWFWRGWFYGTDHVDIALDKVTWFRINTKNPEKELPVDAKEKYENRDAYISNIRNKELLKQVHTEKDTSTLDFYNHYNPFEVGMKNKDDYANYMANLSDEEKALFDANKNYYQLDFSNVGGLVMPLILEFTYTDGTQETQRIPAEIWKQNDEHISKVFVTDKEIQQIVLDPHLETADVDRNNNYWPERKEPTRFELFKEKKRASVKNPMQEAKENQ